MLQADLGCLFNQYASNDTRNSVMDATFLA